MLAKVVRYFWGDLDNNEMKKFGLLGLTFFFLIGAYWLLRTQKDGIFNLMIGYGEYQPIAKMASVFVLVAVLAVYAKFVDMFERDRLLIIFSLFFAVGLVAIALLMYHPTIGLQNTVASPDRYFGWFIYFYIEVFGSIMPQLFWSVVNSTTAPESAKRGYPLVIAGAQVGSILGSLMTMYTKYFGSEIIFVLGACMVAAIAVMVFVYLAVVPASSRMSINKQDDSAKKTGMTEGLKIILTRPYVAGILVLSTVYEIIGTIAEYQMKSIFLSSYSKETFNEFNGFFGVLVNGLAFLMAVFGTSKMMRAYGLRFCLMVFPIITGIAVLGLYLAQVLNITIVPVLYVAVLVVVTIKGLSYAVNNPSKEMMYIPTAKDVKFKAKSVVDAFGGRSAKMLGSSVNKFVPAFGTLISLGLVGFWLAVASYVGYRFMKLTKNNEIIS